MTQDAMRPCKFCGAEARLRAKYCPKCGQELPRAVSIFLSYAHEDKEWRDRLIKHLTLMKRQGLITLWADRDIKVGDEWAKQIDTNLNEADVILLLISPDFMASDYCYSVEMERAMERKNKGEAWVIPIILRYADWHDAPFGKLQATLNGKPLSGQRDKDEALFTVVQEIKRALKSLP